MSTETKLIEYLKNEILEDSSIDIAGQDDLLSTGLLDSMAIVRYINWIADEFEVEIAADEMTIENFISIEAIISFLERKKA